MARRPSPDASDLAWLIGVLWGPAAEVVTGSARPTGEGSTYVIAPNRRWPRLLLPDERSVARAALRAGTGTRSLSAGRRRAALAQALRADPAWRLVRDRVWVPGTDPLRARLEDALGAPAQISAGLRIRSPFRKPMLQVVGPGGQVIAYAKVAWNDVTAANVRAEHQALLAFADAPDAHLRTPEVVAMVEHRGFPVLVTRPMPEGVRRYRAGDDPPPVSADREISDVLTAGGSDASIAERLRSRLAVVADGATRAEGLRRAIVAAATEVAGDLDASGLVAGAWHGDWAPWNLGRDGDMLWIWDWEHWRPHVPVGLDVPHFLFQQRFVAERTPLAEAFAGARAGSSRALASLGYDESQRRALHAAHVLEVSLRYLEAERHGVRPNPRFVSGALDALRDVQP